jgi:hypothetical protein
MTLSYSSSSSFSSSSSKLARASAPSLASCEEPPASAVWLVTIKASFFEDEDENENENESYRDASLAAECRSGRRVRNVVEGPRGSFGDSPVFHLPFPPPPPRTSLLIPRGISCAAHLRPGAVSRTRLFDSAPATYHTGAPLRMTRVLRVMSLAAEFRSGKVVVRNAVIPAPKTTPAFSNSSE